MHSWQYRSAQPCLYELHTCRNVSGVQNHQISNVLERFLASKLLTADDNILCTLCEVHLYAAIPVIIGICNIVFTIHPLLKLQIRMLAGFFRLKRFFHHECHVFNSYTIGFIFVYNLQPFVICSEAFSTLFYHV